MKKTACVILLILLPFAAGVVQRVGPPGGTSWLRGSCQAAEGGAYLSQEYIDTVIQRAYTDFNTAMSIAGTGLNQKQAIARAKGTVQRLKNLAKNDVNRNYILWKVSELEYQIFLEEREIARQDHERTVGRINELVDVFNAEVGKKRPDFVKLKQMGQQFAELDPNKGREIEYLIDKRAITVTRAVLGEIQAALGKNAIGAAREGLDYCVANIDILKVSRPQIEKLESQLQTHLNAGDLKEFIEQDMCTVSRCLQEADLHQAWRKLGSIDRRLSDLQRVAAEAEAKAYAAKRVRLERRLNAIEDSLVDAAIAVYNAKGRPAAIGYVDRVMREAGVSRDKIALVDQAMIGAAMAEHANEHDPELRKVFVDLSDDPTPMGQNVLSDLGDRARTRAQEIKDSIRAAEEEQARVAREEWEKEHRRELRRKAREERREARRRRREERRLARQRERDEEEVVRLEQIQAEMQRAENAIAENVRQQRNTGVTPLSESLEANRQRAHQNVVLIYNLIEQGHENEAYGRFMSLREPLRQYLIPEAYRVLEQTVMGLQIAD
ncbi:MAG: hypothetical protein GF331_08780 [Chitinivibrionales bacterium]|nr:hypothetical protein [Chitinivibrionales bacterium]